MKHWVSIRLNRQKKQGRKHEIAAWNFSGSSRQWSIASGSIASEIGSLSPAVTAK